jgi:S1-C subfamily serine protease
MFFMNKLFTMKIIKYLVTLLILFSFKSMNAQGDAVGAQSVVKIITAHYATENGKQIKKINTGTAWCWNRSTYLVTALHVIAGANEISINHNNQRTVSARVVRVLKEADLALLQIDVELGLVPLVLEDANPNSTLEYSIWGFPYGVYSIQGDDIRFSRSLEANPTLNSILTGNDLKSALRDQGYPLPEARILRISSIIQPGHSGAPIFTLGGKVIGIADGGLRGGTAHINWAFPAIYYVPRLLNSLDAVPQTMSMQVNLYSNPVIVDRYASESTVTSTVKFTEVSNILKNGDGSVNKSWTADYATLYSTLDERSKQEWSALEQAYNISFDDTEYNVYDDYVTAATFAIPSGNLLNVKNGWFYAHNESSTLHYYTLPFAAGTYNNAIATITTTMTSIMTMFQGQQQWYTPANFQDKWVADALSQTATFEAERVNEYYTIYYKAIVDGPNVLIVEVIYRNQYLSDINYFKNTSQFLLSASMAMFTRN